MIVFAMAVAWLLGALAGWSLKSMRTERTEWAADEQHYAAFDREHGIGNHPIGGGAE